MGVLSRVVTPGWVLGVAVAIVVQDRTDSALLSDVLYVGVMVVASAVAWVGVVRRPLGDRTTRGLIACGISLTALGDLLWAVLDRVGAGTDASVADLAWFGSYVFLCAALWRVLSRSRPTGRADLDFVVDAVTIVVISVLIFWTVSVEAIVDDASLTPFVRVVWASYPVVDAVLLALVLRVLLSRRARAAVDVWFGVGVSLWLAADILYLHFPDDPGAVSIQNAAWMVAPVLMARAAWRVRDESPEPARSSLGRFTTASWVAKLVLAVFPLAVPPVLEIIADIRGREDQPLQLFIGTLAVMALAFVRTGRLILSDQRARRELEVARDAALAASEAKSMFLANMSHELRTPLTTVLVAGGLLAETPLNAAQQGLLERVQRAGGNLQTLVEGLLDFSRIEAGRAVLDKAELDLHALLGEVVDARLPLAQGKGVELVLDLDPRLPVWVLGDRIRVFQVLSNLVENALKFTEEGTVVLTARPGPPGGAGDTVEFAVSDTGIGIRREDFESIFESFSQVDPTSTRRYQGTGLGLAICKQLTELMGGTIDVASELGAGTTFTVRLPLPSPRSNGQGHEAAPGALTATPQ